MPKFKCGRALTAIIDFDFWEAFIMAGMKMGFQSISMKKGSRLKATLIDARAKRAVCAQRKGAPLHVGAERQFHRTINRFFQPSDLLSLADVYPYDLGWLSEN
jgi:hypothetical protein